MIKEYSIGGMTCAACSASVERAVRRVQGVDAASVNLSTERLTVRSETDLSPAVFAAVEKTGFTISNVESIKKQSLLESERRRKDMKQRKQNLIIALAFTIPLFYISMGHMVSDMNENQTRGGRELPLDTDFSPGKWQSFIEDRDARISENTKFFGFSNTALYAPVSYIPQAAGILLARTVTDRLAIITYAGRFANWLCVTMILYVAMKLLPFGKEFLALVLLMPMNLHEAFSLAPDAMVVAVSVLMVAYVMHLRYVQKTQLTKIQIGLLYVLALLISLYKIVYLPFCLIYLLIPKERFGSIRKMTIHAVVIAGSVVISSLVWLELCDKFLTHVGANGTLQMASILHHPINYCVTIFRTYSVYTLQLLQQMVGAALGQLNVSTNAILVFAYLFLLFSKTHYNFKNIQDKAIIIEKSIFAVVIMVVILLTSTSLYIQWTYVGQNTIIGLQGRYFIALLLPFYFFVTGMRYDESRDEQITVTSSVVAMTFNMCSCIALLFYCLE